VPGKRSKAAKAIQQDPLFYVYASGGGLARTAYPTFDDVCITGRRAKV